MGFGMQSHCKYQETQVGWLLLLLGVLVILLRILWVGLRALWQAKR